MIRNSGTIKSSIKMELFTIFAIVFVQYLQQTQGKVCSGLHMAPSYAHHPNRSEYYENLYRDCKIIKRNVEITSFSEPIDPTFLDSIEEVDGYIFIHKTSLPLVSMKSLKLVKGSHRFKGRSIHILNNPRLTGVVFPSLKEVVQGEVHIDKNPNLCHVGTIDWVDITYRKNATKLLNVKDECPPCKHGCSSCWTEDICQEIWRTSCDSACPSGCLNDSKTCCSEECLTGCHGHPETCFDCRNFKHGDVCVRLCPLGTFHYTHHCLEQCPNGTFRHRGSCLSTCPDKHYVSEAGECMECPEDDVCLKVCRAQSLDYKNITSLVNCTNIDGSLEILPHRVNQTKNSLVPMMESSLSNIREISHAAIIQGKHVNFTDLHSLRNLEIIKGIKSKKEALVISYTYLRSLNLTKLREVGIGELRITSNEYLESLDFISLAKVGGPVTITNNKKLCYIDNDTFEGISSGLINVSGNRDPEECRIGNMVCDRECKGGCWGPGNKMCRSCLHHKFEGSCVPSCDLNVSFDTGQDGTCERCHRECHGCVGKGADKCIKCINVEERGRCVESCSIDHYVHRANKSCLQCPMVCKNGCSGPLSRLTEGGCNNCHLLLWPEMKCIPTGNMTCPRGYFIENGLLHVTRADGVRAFDNVKTCKPCDHLCQSCKGAGVSSYVCTCKHVEYHGNCVEICPPRHYMDLKNVCQICHPECDECYGPGNDTCYTCRNVRVYLDAELNLSESMRSLNDSMYIDISGAWNIPENSNSSAYFQQFNKFYCNSSCPLDRPAEVEITDGNQVQRICDFIPDIDNSMASTSSNSKRMTEVLVACGLGLLMAAGVTVLVMRRQKMRAEMNKAKLEARLKSMEEQEMEEILTPTDVCPDLASIRLIKEVELERGETIGSGAFGTVYRGIWRPESENIRVAVAIKVLIEGSSSSQHKELLDEARVMASVNHPCCIRILAVCLGRQMMLITPLVAHGSLLDYVRREGPTIGSYSMLKWATQIARGMNYLEQKGIVHRDLAARNILVQGINQVKITDFGLAKLLTKEEGFLSTGGKVPVKWLALESIQHRIFTHKSDVWSYGVALWELFTYGERPYQDISALDVAKHLEAGGRLPQPSICTIDVFMVLFNCWAVDASGRPTFHDLAMEFEAMSRDPERFLIIQGGRRSRIPSDFVENNRSELLRQMRLSDSDDFVCGEDYLDPVFMFPRRDSSKRRTALLTKVDEEEETTFQASPEYTNSPPPLPLPPPPLNQQQSSSSHSSNDGTFSHLVAATAALEESRERKSSDRYLVHPSDEYGFKVPISSSLSDEEDLMALKKSFFSNLQGADECRPVVRMDDYLEPISRIKSLYKESPAMVLENPEYMENPEPRENTEHEERTLGSEGGCVYLLATLVRFIESLQVFTEILKSKDSVPRPGNSDPQKSSPGHENLEASSKRGPTFGTDYYNEFFDNKHVRGIAYYKLESL